MTYRRLILLLAGIVAGVVTLVGCGSNRSALSTAPSVALTAVPIDQSVITPQETTAYVITSIVAGTSCPNLQFQISTYLIKTSASTAYEGGSCANLQAGTKLTALNGARPNMNEMLVYATRIVIQQTTAPPTPTPTPTPTPAPSPAPPKTPAPAPVPPPVSFETSVTVSSVVSTTSCPYREFMVGSYRLTTSALTRYEGGRCSDITTGATLGIVATTGAKDASVLVSTIAFKHEPEPEPSSGESEGVWAQVTVDRLVEGGACPALSFLVGPYTVTANAATLYDGGMCTDLKAGAVLRLDGAKQRDDHVLATRISFPD